MRHDESLYPGQRMRSAGRITIGLDCGATTSKVCGVDAGRGILGRGLSQRPTRAAEGAAAIVATWMELVRDFLESEGLTWDAVGAIGLAIPGPYLAPGVLGPMPNMPASLTGWAFLTDLRTAAAIEAGRPIPVETANDGLLAGLAEATLLQQTHPGSVLMLSPGSGLGCSFVNAKGEPLHGDHGAGVIFCHQPMPYSRLGLPLFRCGCGRDWGCHEAYTALAGIPQYLRHFEPMFPDHPLYASGIPAKEAALSLRSLAQQNDPLAAQIFDMQAKALGLTVAVAAMAYDPTHVVIGGGLMDPEATTAAFRERYFEQLRESAATYLWVESSVLHYHAAALGELSQAVGAALHAQAAVS
jgi:glucokinase